MTVLLLLIASSVLEIILYTPLLWRIRLPIAVMLVAAIPGLSILLFYQQASFIALLILPISLLRVINLMRVAQNRLRPERLYRVSIRTSGYALLAQTVLVVLINSGYSGWPKLSAWYVFAAVQLIVGGIVLVTTLRTLKRLEPAPLDKFLSDKELPTLTVVIPARNETPELVDCLNSVLQSDYPKLEVIVLDDCSHDKTPEIIKQFAHDGVRFIQGEEPSDRWLPKNAAYERLLNEANGDVILFCGVDVRFAPSSLRTLVNTMAFRDKKMISVLPTRSSTSLQHAVMQPLRYWWEIALPRRLFNRPAVLSTCWAIDSATLRSMGGFKSYAQSLLPERHFARTLVRTDHYSFVRSNSQLFVETTKPLRAQRDIVVRMRYPQVHRRLELTFLLAVLEATLLFGPFTVLAFGVLANYPLLVLMALGSTLALVITNFLIVGATNKAGRILALLVLPVSVLVEMYLGVESAIKYEFSTVEWKGRNICLPVMQVIPKLPKAD